MLGQSEPEGCATDPNILMQANRVCPITSKPVSEQAVEKIIDGRDRLAVRGLINVHTHSPEKLPKASKEKLPAELWLLDALLLGSYSPRNMYVATVLGTIEMLEMGTTAILDDF